MTARSAKANISIEALQHNLSVVKHYAPKKKVMCALKANAYGHGLLAVAKALQAADGFALAHLSEALALRAAGFEQEIIVLQGPQSLDDVAEFEKFNLHAAIHHKHQLELIKASALKIWLKVNTGMNRLGFALDEVESVKNDIKRFDNVELIALLTHFANADLIQTEKLAVEDQLAIFKSISSENMSVSTSNSGGLIQTAELKVFESEQEEWVRPGIMLYGVNPFEESSKTSLDLKPVMSLSAPIIAINQCKKGDSVGYGASWQAQTDSLIAVIAMGYGDGYPRHAKNNTPVIINGHICPLVGRVSMDLITVDITAIAHELVKIGDDALLWGEGTFGKERKYLPVETIAEYSNTIAYELLCAVSDKVHYNYN